jgi:intein/homing endonuclease
MFDLFKLHQPIDIGPESWICFGGKNLHDEVILAMEKNKKSKKQIARNYSSSLGCSMGPFEEVVYHRKHIPIPILNYLIDNNIISKRAILENVDELKVNTSKAKPLKAVKNLSLDLCRIAGAFAADGNLHARFGFQGRSENEMKLFDNSYRMGKFYRFRTNDLRKALELSKKNHKNIRIWQDYSLDLTDGYRFATEKYKEWLETTFNIRLPVLREFRNAYRLNFSNKIIARYLTTFLGFPSGKKSNIVKEPEIIRNAGIDFRNAFLQGLFTFDGCVNKKGVVCYISKSKNLINSIDEIICKNNIKLRIYEDIKRERWHISFTKGESKKCLNFFVPGTKKWLRLKEHYGL